MGFESSPEPCDYQQAAIRRGRDVSTHFLCLLRRDRLRLKQSQVGRWLGMSGDQVDVC